MAWGKPWAEAMNGSGKKIKACNGLEARLKWSRELNDGCTACYLWGSWLGASHVVNGGVTAWIELTKDWSWLHASHVVNGWVVTSCKPCGDAMSHSLFIWMHGILYAVWCEFESRLLVINHDLLEAVKEVMKSWLGKRTTRLPRSREKENDVTT